MEVTGPPSRLEEQRPQGLGSLGRNLAGLGYGGLLASAGGSREVAAAAPRRSVPITGGSGLVP